MRTILIVILLLLPTATGAMEKADRVVVVKSEARLYLIRNEKVLHAFPVAMGNPKGHKRQQGDRRTPEGSYRLDLKNPNSAYYRSIRISYPNAQDCRQARQRGVDPGGWIMIHGQKNGLGHLAPITQQMNWTDGCIAVTNEEMDVIWQAVDVGTPIDIRP
jgi:murein L,D-transpeptidase YafK